MSDLLAHCSTPRQREIMATYISEGSARAAAGKLGIARQYVDDTLKKVKLRAAKKDRGQHVDSVPEGYKIKGVSTLYNDAGEVSAQWVKTDTDRERMLEALERAVASVCDPVKPLGIVPAPKARNAELCTLYTLTDYHLGMLAWDKEGGDDWDISIAEKTFQTALSQMITGSPDSELGILNIQGDFNHWDSLEPVTPSSGHVLDADTRFDKLVETCIRVTINAVEALLQKHKRVRVIICEGNHDMSSSVWMRKMVKAVFTKNKRVEVDDTAFPFYAYLHGRIMLAFHHGHKVKNKSLPALFSAEPRYREMWGQALYTYIHTGHYHHAEQDMAESGGAIVERHPTLAARDAYAARGGYVSWRAARAITYHQERGEVARTTVVP